MHDFQVGAVFALKWSISEQNQASSTKLLLQDQGLTKVLFMLQEERWGLRSLISSIGKPLFLLSKMSKSDLDCSYTWWNKGHVFVDATSYVPLPQLVEGFFFRSVAQLESFLQVAN